MTSNIIPRLNMSVSSVKLSLGGITNAESEPGVERVIGGQGPQMSEIATELARAETAAKERTVNEITWVQWSSDRTGPNMSGLGGSRLPRRSCCVEQYPNAALRMSPRHRASD
jgi:hypothetical protein